jgi:hypothetical protein
VPVLVLVPESGSTSTCTSQLQVLPVAWYVYTPGLRSPVTLEKVYEEYLNPV